MRRLASLRSLLILLTVYCLVLSEMRFDWVEHAIGAYLVTTNETRPRSGQIWEKSRNSSIARQTLEQIVTDRQASQRDAVDAASLLQIAEILSEQDGVMLSVDHFRQLYRNLPPRLADEIASPIELLQRHSSGKWERTYCRKDSAGLTFYLLDRTNRVLMEMPVPADLLQRIARFETFFEGPLEALPNFQNRIYPADRFFQALADLPPETRPAVVPEPGALLALPGPVRRIGISDEVLSGFIEIGFEFREDGSPRVMRVQARDWGIWLMEPALASTEDAPPGGRTR